MTSSDHYLKRELYNLVKKDSTIFEFLQSGSLDGIWYWDLENTANEWMSPQFWTTLGYDPETREHLASEWQDLINPEDLQTALGVFEKHCMNPNHPYDQVVRYRHQNGSTVWVRCRGIAIRDDTGKPVRMLGAHTDITQQKLAEESLSQSKDYLSVLFDSTLNGIMVIDAETHMITDVNVTATKLIGLPKDKIIGQECHRFVCPAEKGSCPIADLGQTIDESERTLLTSNDESKSIIKTVKQLSFDDKEYYIESFIDISDRKTVEMEREGLISELQKALDEIKTLKGIVPICSNCKKIRDDKGFWNYLESYIESHSDASFSHSMCPECSDEFYGDKDWYIEMKKKKGKD